MVPVMLMRTGYECELTPARQPLAARILTAFWSWFRAAEDYLESRRQRRGLIALDDRMLKDIGLSRADVMRVSAPATRPHKNRHRAR
jgi:uncharacterized protein YjiS (DUF1127 family)